MSGYTLTPENPKLNPTPNAMGAGGQDAATGGEHAGAAAAAGDAHLRGPAPGAADARLPARA